jgi:hypothetical protein
LKKRFKGPWLRDYVSELDETPELDHERAAYCQSQIGVLYWIVELGRVDIITDVSKLASHIAWPREGHLEAMFYVVAYLKCKHNARLVFDPTYPETDYSKTSKAIFFWLSLVLRLFVFNLSSFRRHNLFLGSP